jgi:hypothetical protein
MIHVVFRIAGSDINHRVNSVPMAGEIVYLHELNGPAKVEKVTHSISKESHYITIYLGA